ncbi:MAG: hypothetical protein KJ795_14545 [Gammaproteobacteria bacterium]|nr:hypothetical protein [Gammaproteobacteria bacterium]MBU1969196.1 hypothetical protein [Gammaproteobacteria bacterium]
MKKIVLSLAGVLAATAFAPEASAIPAFARQQGKACSTCHFQHYPALNDYGRSFKAGGFTDMGKQGLIKGPAMSLPEVANSSLFFKFRYQDTNGTDGTGTGQSTIASGEWQIPDEFALLMGGRVAENIGYMFEGQLADGTAPVLAGFKMPIMFPVGEGEMKVGVVPFSTDGLGASYGFELLNTGAVRNVRISEMRSETSAQQYIGAAREAQGLAFVVVDPMFFVNVTKYTDGLAGGQKMLGGLTYLRAGVTPTVGEWDLGVGVQSWSGTSTEANGFKNDDVKATAIDAQAQGAVAGMPMGAYFTYATAPASGTTVNVFNTGTANAKKAMTIMAELGVLPGSVTVMAAYRKADTGAATNSKDDAITIGGTYAIAQNVSFQVSHTTRSKNGNVGRYAGGGDQFTNFMLSAGL